MLGLIILYTIRFFIKVGNLTRLVCRLVIKIMKKVAKIGALTARSVVAGIKIGMSGVKKIIEGLKRLKKFGKSGISKTMEGVGKIWGKLGKTIGWGFPLAFLRLKIPLKLLFLFSFLLFAFCYLLLSLPNPAILKTRQIPQTTRILDRNGKVLYEVYLDQNRTIVALSDIPRVLVDATLAIEDKNFYSHFGIDPFGIARAVKVYLFESRVEGGSTITQQLVKRTLLNGERKLSRKLKEVILALWTEALYTKNEILEMYLNEVSYGGTAYGVAAAAKTYFGKELSELTLSEAAFLAGLPASPTVYSPYGSQPEEGFSRQRTVLNRMFRDGKITAEEEASASGETLLIIPPKTKISAPHFVMYIKNILAQIYGVKKSETGGLKVTTTLDSHIQEIAEEAVTEGLLKMKNLSVGNAAVLVTKPQTGEILTMVGSRDYFDFSASGNVNVVTSLRSPGSAIKPVTYGLSLESGYTPASILDDAPVTYSVPGQKPYSPVNYDGRFHGRVTLRSALANSYNIPAVRLISALGVGTVFHFGREMGIESWQDEGRYGLSLTLGGGEVTMLDLARAYGTLANEGKNQSLSPILSIDDSRGKPLERFSPKEGKRVIPSEIAFIINDILADPVARMNTFGAQNFLTVPGNYVSVKTGTSNDKRDNWTIGYTRSYLVAVWIGNNDNRPMSPYLESGGSGAAVIWNKIMKELLAEEKEKTGKAAAAPLPPGGLVKVSVCRFNGLLPCENCPTMEDYFLSGTEPRTHCKIEPSPSPSPTP